MTQSSVTGINDPDLLTTQVDIKRLVADVLELTLPLVRKTVKLVNNVDHLPKIVGDTGRIVQILYNLVGNAAKFTAHGTITLSAGVGKDQQHIYVSVTDTGAGIPKDKIRKIFGAFEQVSESVDKDSILSLSHRSKRSMWLSSLETGKHFHRLFNY